MMEEEDRSNMKRIYTPPKLIWDSRKQRGSDNVYGYALADCDRDLS